MRQVIAHLFSSLDGYASDRDDEDMQWAMSRQGMQQLTQGQHYVRSLGLVVLGGVTYEKMSGYWPNTSDEESGGWATIMNSAPKMVFSRDLTQDKVSWQNTTVNNGDLVEELAAKGGGRRRHRAVRQRRGSEVVAEGWPAGPSAHSGVPGNPRQRRRKAHLQRTQHDRSDIARHNGA
jgi:dihydrofolate reductase